MHHTYEELETDFLKDPILAEIWPKVNHLVTESIAITFTDIGDDTDVPIGTSKFGGCPDLPPSIQWEDLWSFEQGSDEQGNEIDKHHLSFVAQINFQEIKPFDRTGDLPDSGIVYFFCEGDNSCAATGQLGDSSELFKVFYYDGDLQALSRHPQASTIRATAQEYDSPTLFKTARLKFESIVCLPVISEYLYLGYDYEEQEPCLTYEQSKPYNRLVENRPFNYVLGYPIPIQRYDNYFWGIPQDRQLLLQVASNDELGMQWVDNGLLYFLIDRKDLHKRDFTNMFCYAEYS
jgi:uncharacterized protein YwqG